MELKNTEKLEHSVVALTIEITKAEFEAAKDKAFKKSGKNITVPGFRKGKAPRKMIEKLYGEGVFFEEAFNILYPQAMDMAVEKSGIKMVGRADVDLGEPAEEGGLTIIAKVPVEPEVELGEYKGIEVPKETVSISKAEVDAELGRMQDRNARIETVDREAKTGDTVNVNSSVKMTGNIAINSAKTLTIKGAGLIDQNGHAFNLGHKDAKLVADSDSLFVKITVAGNYELSKVTQGEMTAYIVKVKSSDDDDDHGGGGGGGGHSF